MFNTINKIAVKEDVQGRFVAVVTGTWIDSTCTAEYRTSPDRTGLWVWDDARHDWRQIIGTGQFAARTASSFRRRLRRVLTWK
jgi:hypothetical protein